jgi:hypothetical protein
VNHLVEFGGVQGAVRPIVPCIFHDEKDGNLVSDFEEGWKGNAD